MMVVVAAESAATVLLDPPPTPANAPNPNALAAPLKGTAARTPYTPFDPDPARDRMPIPPLS
jgi:hypothetical protein